MRFFSVTKPGIIVGNIITLTGGFFLGSHGNIHFLLYLTTLVGMSLVIASGCVLNNYIDRDIDQLMERTKNRVLVKGLISEKIALLYATFLGVLGIFLLYWAVNRLTAAIALFGWLVYVVIYSFYAKRHSRFGTSVGAIAGAIPPVVGFCATTNTMSAGAIILFLILFFWQMPHSYAIAIYRLDDYAAASIPILPIKKNIHVTKLSMLIFVIAFTFAAIMPTVFGYRGILYLIAALATGLIWLMLSVKGLSTQNNKTWARKMFILSIINITFLSVMMSLK